MEPYRLIGLPYRLGADPERHGATDCLGLCRAVLHNHGIPLPPAQRSWYRRLRRGDHTIFREQLEAWGAEVTTPRLGSIALCISEAGHGLGVWCFDGWLIYGPDSTVIWVPPSVPEVAAIFCPLR